MATESVAIQHSAAIDEIDLKLVRASAIVDLMGHAGSNADTRSITEASFAVIRMLEEVRALVHEELA